MALKASISPITAGTLALLSLCPVPGVGLAGEEGCRSDAPFALSFERDLVSLTSQQACLAAILQELQRQAPVTIHLPPGLSREAVSESFSGAPLGEALARILKRSNYLLSANPPDDPAPARVAGTSGSVEVWIIRREFPSSAAPDRKTVRAELLERARDILAADTMQLMAQARGAPDPQLRANAVALLVHAEKDAAVAETILTALEDPALRVRAAALHVVADLGPEAPGAAAAVAHMARRDESPELRMHALEKLFAANYRRDLAKATVLAALEDPEAEVRALAQNLMELVSARDGAD